MLIAIMGNTFDQVMERKHRNAQETKLRFMSAFFSLLTRKGRKVDTKTVMFIVTPFFGDDIEESQVEDDWEGSLQYLKRIMQSRLDEVQRNVQE